MNRYDVAAGVEGEFEPGSRHRVLRNLLGVKSKLEMDVLESEALIAVQADYYDRITSETRFAAELLCEMHRDWLGPIYSWAGQYRTVELAKGSFRWPPANMVAANMQRFEQETLALHTPCVAGTLEDVCHRLAVVHAELLLIHPFREGNGRLARWLADLMAAQAGLPPPLYQFRGRGSVRTKAHYLDAVIRGYAADYADLERFFAEAVKLRLAAD